MMSSGVTQVRLLAQRSYNQIGVNSLQLCPSPTNGTHS